MNLHPNGILSRLASFMTPITRQRRSEVIEQLDKASSPGFDFFLFVFLSCIIATFGLITNSVAVIIGAMLVAPLMSPILAISMASVAGEGRVFQRALLALIEGVVLAVILSFIVSWITQQLPFGVLHELPSEVSSRTQPTPIDLGIALAGGVAAAYALAQPHLSAALPGVAIATALMPPLCTIGIGISLSNQKVALGASLLFATNLVAILFAGILVFVLLGFRPIVRNGGSWFNIPRSLVISAILVLIVTIPLIVLTLRFVNDARFQQQVRQVVDEVIIQDIPDSQLVSIDLNGGTGPLSLQVTVRAARQPSYGQVLEWQKDIASRLQRELAFQLVVVPATKLDPLIPPTPTPTFTPGPSPSPTITPTRTRLSSAWRRHGKYWDGGEKP